jgi:hypothetical protein
MVLLLQSQRRFQGINLAADNPQRQALEHVLRTLADARQKTLLFYTKEDPARIENLIEAPRYAALRAKLDDLIGGYTSADLVYLPPVDALRPQHYLDHTHLTYAGYQVLVEQMWPRLRPLVGDVGPGGAAVSSQGRKPLVPGSSDRREPQRGDSNTEIGDSVAPSGLTYVNRIPAQGLTPPGY